MLDYIELAERVGARVACGGGPPADEQLANGLYVEPTVLVDVTQDMRVAQDEILHQSPTLPSRPPVGREGSASSSDEPPRFVGLRVKLAPGGSGALTART